LLVVEAQCTGHPSQLAALACVFDAPAARSLPLRHLELYRPVHAFATGALVDPRWPVAALSALLDGIEALPGGGALRCVCLRSDGPLAQAAREATRRHGARWYTTRRWQRAATRVARLPVAADDAPIAREPLLGADGSVEICLKPTSDWPDQMRRGIRRLEADVGPVRLRLLRGKAIDLAVIDRHLALEDSGWKSRRGTSMLASTQTTAFFRDIALAAAQVDEVFFCELLAGELLVASTSNFIGGREAFAFKLGWEPSHARASPGLLVDAALARHAAQLLPEIDLLDGCAEPGAYLDRIWDARLEMRDGYLAWGRQQRAVLSGIETARRLRDSLRPASADDAVEPS
jgi:hypothetical protein